MAYRSPPVPAALLLSRCSWLVLPVLLGVALPLHLAMPVFVDSAYFDQCARSLLRHGHFYRDVFCHVFPGMVWLHAAIRAAFGWRTETIRLADFLIVITIVWLLARQIRPLADRCAAGAWPAFLLFFAYFGTSEWCHAQPDPWLLLPALAALILHERRVRLTQGSTLLALRTHANAAAFIEGLCWSLAFLIKPFVAASLLACWAISGFQARRTGAVRQWATEAAFALAGFTIPIVGTIAWLVVSGDARSFLEPYRASFNAAYFLYSRDWLDRTLALVAWYLPWSLIHVLAVPLAGIELWQLVRSSADHEPDLAGPLLSGVYLAWLLQANFVQRQLPYQLVPPLLLGLALVLARVRHVRRPLGISVIVLVVAAALPHPVLLADLRTWDIRPHPLLDSKRLSLWWQCATGPHDPALRDRLALEPTGPHWSDLARVEEYLRRKGLHDRELTCYSLTSVPLYGRLDLEPSSRWVFLWSACAFFPQHGAWIVFEVLASPQRFIVTDIRDVDPDHALNPDLDPPLPDAFPWYEPVIFRSGVYRVHRVTSPPSRGG